MIRCIAFVRPLGWIFVALCLSPSVQAKTCNALQSAQDQIDKRVQQQTQTAQTQYLMSMIQCSSMTDEAMKMYCQQSAAMQKQNALNQLQSSSQQETAKLNQQKDSYCGESEEEETAAADSGATDSGAADTAATDTASTETATTEAACTLPYSFGADDTMGVDTNGNLCEKTSTETAGTDGGVEGIPLGENEGVTAEDGGHEGEYSNYASSSEATSSGNSSGQNNGDASTWSAEEVQKKIEENEGTEKTLRTLASDPCKKNASSKECALKEATARSGIYNRSGQ